MTIKSLKELAAEAFVKKFDAPFSFTEIPEDIGEILAEKSLVNKETVFQLYAFGLQSKNKKIQDKCIAFIKRDPYFKLPKYTFIPGENPTVINNDRLAVQKARDEQILAGVKEKTTDQKIITAAEQLLNKTLDIRAKYRYATTKILCQCSGICIAILVISYAQGLITSYLQ